MESSDYTFVKALYGLSPEKINLWAFSPTIRYRQAPLLTMKTKMLSGRPNPKIFNIQNQHYRGFQMGEPAERWNLELHLYSDNESIHITFFPSDKSTPLGLTQPEINRMVQSLRHVP